MLQYKTDMLRNIRNLPQNILKNIGNLILNRIGTDPDAFMITEDIPSFIYPKQTYLVEQNQLILSPKTASFYEEKVYKNEQNSLPLSAAVCEALWLKDVSINLNEANILGGMGLLQFVEDCRKINIPIVKATAENLAFYDSRLIQVGETCIFDSPDLLPLTVVNVGKTYVEHFLMIEELGGGAYLEYHDQPHFWMPMNSHCTGHVLLAREIDNKYYMTAFSIPYGTGIYTGPFTLHADSFLVGKFMVVYTTTTDYSTVVLKNKNSELIHLDFYIDLP